MKPQDEMLKELVVWRRVRDRIHVLGGNEMNLSHTVHDAYTGDIIERDSFKGNYGELLGVSVGMLNVAVPFIVYYGISDPRLFYDLLPLGVTIIGGGVGGLSLQLYQLTPSQIANRRKTKEYVGLVTKFKEFNMIDSTDSVGDVNEARRKIRKYAKEGEFYYAGVLSERLGDLDAAVNFYFKADRLDKAEAVYQKNGDTFMAEACREVINLPK